MPPDCRRLSLSELLERAFPASPEERREIAARFAPGTPAFRANPDLPDIYAVFLAVGEEWRDGRCALRVTVAAGAAVDFSTPVSRLLPPLTRSSRESGSRHASPAELAAPVLALRLEQQYRPLEYAVRHGFWPSRQELTGWMRSLTALYFLDKHEVPLHPESLPEPAPALREALAALQSRGLIALPLPAASENGSPTYGSASYAIPPLGRRFIAALLAETEDLIDQYDLYKDTLVDLDRETAEFGTGRGADLRVEAFLADGLDPVRSVFLLRLYDGTLDHRLRDWQSAIEDEGFYEGILEPVVNRDGAAPEVIELVIESGLSLLEERQEQARRQAAEQTILRQARAESVGPQ